MQNKKMVLGVLVLIGVIGLTVAACNSKPSTTPNQPSFDQLAQDRFAQVKSAAPELDSIECDGTCDSGVVYFNFNKQTEDLETVMRGNTATFSKFMADNNKGSNVALFARLSGKVILQCTGSKGAVKECK